MIHKIQSALIGLLFTIQIYAENPIKSSIDKVTVFRTGAQIKRTAQCNLKQGFNTVVISNLPSGFDNTSVQISSKSKSEIISVGYRDNFTNEFETNPNYKKLKEQLDALIKSKQDETVLFETWKEEENLLLANKKVGGEQTALTPEQLNKIADLYRTRLLEVKKKLLESKQKQESIDNNIKKVNAQLTEWMGQNKNILNGEIVLEISATKAIDDVLEISYIDYRAYWATNFDLRLETLSQPLNLVTKGKITQNTGEDWGNVNLVLSTGNPSLRTQLPALTTWFLHYYQNDISIRGSRSQNADYEIAYQKRANVRAEALSGDEMVIIRENITFNEFTIPGKMNIPSDNKPHEIKIQESDIPVDYSYFSIPKMDTRVYLKANIPDWEQYNLSSGDIKLYFEGTYVGTSYLDAGTVSDTLTVSLGQDIAITAKREKLKDYTKTTFLSSKKQLQSGWELTFKNNKTQPIELIFQDQIPISSDNTMEIEVNELSGGKLNPSTGIVEWTVKLKPGEQIKKKIVYTVKIPKDKKVVLNG